MSVAEEQGFQLDEVLEAATKQQRAILAESNLLLDDQLQDDNTNNLPNDSDSEESNEGNEDNNNNNNNTNNNNDYAALRSTLSSRLSSPELQTITKNTKDNQLSFHNEYFQIFPMEGEIWPNSQTKFTVTFLPQFEQLYTTTAYCEITGRENRLPLYLKGQGMGPRAVFSLNVLDIGTVYVNTTQYYELKIKNTGDIEAHYQLRKNINNSNTSNLLNKFKFTPEEGILAIGEEQRIEVTFTPDSLGELNVPVEWDLKRAASPLVVTFKGKLLGPTFDVDVDLLDFGIVSYGFPNSKVFRLRNTEEIPMNYKLRITNINNNNNTTIAPISPTNNNNNNNNGDNTTNNTVAATHNVEKDFIILPSSGTVLPLRSQEIKIHFTPLSVQRYSDTNLIMDVECVGDAVLSIPIHAECVVPQVYIYISNL